MSHTAGPPASVTGLNRPRRGRPAIGTQVDVVLSGDVLALVERVAAQRGVPRGALLREIVDTWALRQP